MDAMEAHQMIYVIETVEESSSCSTCTKTRNTQRRKMDKTETCSFRSTGTKSNATCQCWELTVTLYYWKEVISRTQKRRHRN